MRRAIQRFKYNGEYQRGYDLGHRLSQLAPSRFPVQKIDFVMPVPLHPRRYRARGFNQSGILAECIGNSLDLPVVTPVLRIRNTSPQVRLSADERLSNLEEAFRIDGSKSSLVENSVVLLVDDVTTTGATIAAVASTLESGGCREAYGLTLAREQ